MNNKQKGRVPKILHSERGAAAMEFAFILPILATLVFGIIDFGRMLWNQELLVGAARQAARQGSAYAGGDDVQSAVEDALRDAGVSTEGLSVIVTGQGGAFGTPLNVNASIPWDFMVIDELVPGLDVDRLRANVRMMNEGT